jgi:hypothetical protein
LLLAYLGDALWVAALTIMFGASRQAWARTEPGQKLRLPIGEIGRGLGVWALPAGAFALSLWLALQARDRADEGDVSVIVFGVRATAASLLALLHLRWLRAALPPGEDA